MPRKPGMVNRLRSEAQALLDSGDPRLTDKNRQQLGKIAKLDPNKNYEPGYLNKTNGFLLRLKRSLGK